MCRFFFFFFNKLFVVTKNHLSTHFKKHNKENQYFHPLLIKVSLQRLEIHHRASRRDHHHPERMSDYQEVMLDTKMCIDISHHFILLLDSLFIFLKKCFLVVLRQLSEQCAIDTRLQHIHQKILDQSVQKQFLILKAFVSFYLGEPVVKRNGFCQSHSEALALHQVFVVWGSQGPIPMVTNTGAPGAVIMLCVKSFPSNKKTY